MITVVADGELLYRGYNHDDAWQAFMDAKEQWDVTYINDTDPSNITAEKKWYYLIYNPWGNNTVMCRTAEEAYNFCVNTYKPMGLYVQHFKFFQSASYKKNFRVEANWVKNFYIRKDGGIFANESAIYGQRKCNIDDTTSQY